MGGYGNVEEMMIRLNVRDVADEEQEDDDDSERHSDGDYDSKGTDGGGGDQNDSDGDYDSNGTGGGGGDQNNSDADYESNGTGGGGGDQNDSDGDNDSNGTSGGGGGGDNSGSDDDMMCGSGNDESDGGDQGDGSDNGGGGGGGGGGGDDDGDGDANADGSDDGGDDKGDGDDDSGDDGDGGGNGGNDPAGGGDDDDLLIFSQVSDADATESSSDSVEMMGDDEEFAQAFAYEDEDAWIPVHALRPDMHVDMRDRMIHRLRRSWCLRKAGGHPSVDFYYEEALRRLETAVRRLMRRLRARTMWVPRDNHIEFQTLLQEPGIILLPTNFDQFLTRSLTRIAVIQE